MQTEEYLASKFRDDFDIVAQKYDTSGEQKVHMFLAECRLRKVSRYDSAILALKELAEVYEENEQLEDELDIASEVPPNILFRASVALNCVLIIVVVMFSFLLADKAGL